MCKGFRRKMEFSDCATDVKESVEKCFSIYSEKEKLKVVVIIRVLNDVTD